MVRPVYVAQVGSFIEFPDDASDAEITSYLKAKFPTEGALGEQAAAAPAPPTGPDESSILGRFAYGAGTGFTDIPGGIASLFYPAEEAAKTAPGQFSEEARKYLQETFGIDPTKDPTAAQQAAQALGSVASFLVPGSAVAKGASLAGKTAAAAGRAATVTAGAQGVALGAEARSERIRDQLASGMEISEEQQLASQRLSGLFGAAEAYPIGRFFGPLQQLLSKVPVSQAPALNKIVQSRLGRVTRAGAAEGAQEVASGIANDIMEYGIYNPDVEIGQDILSNAGTGAFAGSFVEGVIQLAAGRKLRPYRQLQEDLAKESAVNAQAQRQGEISRAAEELRQFNVEGDVEVVEDDFDGISRFTIRTPAGNTVGDFLDPVEAEEAIDIYKQRTDAKVTVRKPSELPSVFPAKINGKEYQTTDEVIADRDSLVAEAEGLASYMSRPDVIKREATRQNVSEAMIKKATEDEVADMTKKITKLNDFVAAAKPFPARDELGEAIPKSRAFFLSRAGQPVITEAVVPEGTVPEAIAPEAAAPEAITPEVVMPEAMAPEAPIGAAEVISGEGPITEAPAIVEAPEPVSLAQPEAPTITEAPEPSAPPVEGVPEEPRPLAGPLKEAPAPRRTFAQAEAEGPILRDYNQATIDRYAGIYTALKSRLSGKVPKDVDVKLEELIGTDRNLLIRGQARVEKTPNGIKSVVDLSTGILRPDMTVEQAVAELAETLNHEIIHVLRDQGVIRPAEWKILSRAAVKTKVPGRSYTYLDKAQTIYTPGGQPISEIYADPDAVIEEAVAEMYKDWVKNKNAAELGKSADGKNSRGLFNRITEFFRSIFRVLKSSKYQEVFKGIETGEVGAREGVGREAGTRFSAGPVFYSAVLRAAESANQEKATGPQWLGIIKNTPGVKPEEIALLGLESALSSKGLITKKQVAEIIEANDIQIEEVSFGFDSPVERQKLAERQMRLYKLQDDSAEMGGLPSEELAEMNELSAEVRAAEERAKSAQHADKVLPGGRAYRELLLTIPNNPGMPFEHDHFPGVKNFIVHVRFDERTDKDGRKILFINELQSDWHQQARKKGYMPASLFKGIEEHYKKNIAFLEAEESKIIEALEQQISQKKMSPDNFAVTYLSAQKQIEKKKRDLNDQYAVLKSNLGVPEAPFKSNWDEFALKRMVRYAAENGFDAVSWPSTPEQVSEIEGWGNLLRAENGRLKLEGGYDVTPIVDRYTKDLPRVANKLYKKFDTRTTQSVVSPDSDGGYKVNTLPITESMKGSVMGGQARFSAAPLPPYIEAKNRTLFVPEKKQSIAQSIFDFFTGPSTEERILNSPMYGNIAVKGGYFGTRANLARRVSVVDRHAAFELLEKIANEKDTGNYQRREATQSAVVALAMADRKSQLTASSVMLGAPTIEFSRPGDIQSATVTVREDADKLIDIFRVMLQPGPIDPATNEPRDKRTVFKTYATAMRAIGLKAAGKPVPRELDDTYINTTIQFTQQNYPEIVEAYKSYQRFNKKLLTAARDAGRITNAELARFTQQMDYYGFYRELYEEQLTPGAPSRLAGDIKIREYKGSQRGKLIEDPMLVILSNVNFWMGAITHNVAVTKAFELAKNMGEARLLGASEKPDLSRGESEQVMFYRKDGVLKRFAVKDPLLVTSLGADDRTDMGRAMEILGMPTSAIRETITRDPAFMVANLLRDTLSSWITSGEDITPFIGTAKGFASALKGSASFQALMGRGVVGSHDLAMRSPAEMAAIIRRRALPGNVLNIASTQGTQGLIMAGWDRLGVWSEASDAATRIAVYEAAIKSGMSEAEAAFRAIEIMNFSRRGSSGLLRILTQLIPFLNARIQGMDVLYQAGKAGIMTASGYRLGERDANLGKRFLVRGTILAALSVALEMMLEDDEDYKELPDYVKNSNLLIPLKWFGVEGGYFAAIPNPFEAGLLFSTIPRELYKAAKGETSAREGAKFFWEEFASTFGLNPIPQIAGPIAEIYFNKDMYTGLPLISEGKLRLTPELQYDSRTSTVARMLGKLEVNYNFTTGKFEGVSPIVIDQLVSGYGGPFGSYIMQGVGMLMEEAGAGPERLPRDITQLPMIKRFLLDAESRSPKSVAQAYELFRVVDEANRSFSRLRQTGDTEAVMDYLAENKDVLSYKKYIYKLFDGLNKISARERQIERDETMTRDEKFEAMRKLREVRARLTSQISEINKKLGR
jgi:hypothetical protein